MSIFRQPTDVASALAEYLDRKRQEFINSSGAESGSADLLRLREDLVSLQDRVSRRILTSEAPSACYLVVGRVQSGKTGHQLGMLAWAADNCDVAVMFTGVTEALNGQTSHRITRDLATLPTPQVSTVVVPTRTTAERGGVFFESVRARVDQRLAYREGGTIWPERLPILVSMKTRPRVDALKWVFEQVAEIYGEGVIALIIDDEADQVSPNALTRRDEEAATYAELKALRDAAGRHVWLSYTATPQAIFLTETDGALRPDYCAVSHAGAGYFGVSALMERRSAASRIPVEDWRAEDVAAGRPPQSLRRAVCDLLCASWLRAKHPTVFYASAADTAAAARSMRSVQMLIHTSANTADHRAAYDVLQIILGQIREDIEIALEQGTSDNAIDGIGEAWAGLFSRVRAIEETPPFPDRPTDSQLYDLGRLLSLIEVRIVNSDSNRPGAERLPAESDGWDVHPLWIVIGGDILGRGLTIPQLVTTYFLRLPAVANEDTVSQQMRFCGYRSAYAHVLTVHALPETFESFEYLSGVERVLLAKAEKWADSDTNLREDEPALWYITRPSRRMRPTRLLVRDRELRDISQGRQLFSANQFFLPQYFIHNSSRVVDFLDGSDMLDAGGGWSLIETGVGDVRQLLGGMAMSGSDDSRLAIAIELMDPSLEELGVAGMPAAVFVRGTDVISRVASGEPPALEDIPFGRALAAAPPPNGEAEWRAAFGVTAPVRAEKWFDFARIRVPHVGDAQRAPVERLTYDAVAVLIEPLNGMASDSHVVAGLAISVLAPEDFEVRLVGVSAS